MAFHLEVLGETHAADDALLEFGQEVLLRTAEGDCHAIVAVLGFDEHQGGVLYRVFVRGGFREVAKNDSLTSADDFAFFADVIVEFFKFYIFGLSTLGNLANKIQLDVMNDSYTMLETEIKRYLIG